MFRTLVSLGALALLAGELNPSVFRPITLGARIRERRRRAYPVGAPPQASSAVGRYRVKTVPRPGSLCTQM